MEVLEKSPVADAIDVIWHPHPVTPIAGRETVVAEVLEGRTVREMLLMAGIDPHAEIAIYLDDRLLTVEEWDVICPRVGQLVNVQATASGGGGGGSMASILMIALMLVVSYFTFGAGAAAMAAQLGVTAGQLQVIGALTIVAGSMLISSVFAPKTPAMDVVDKGDASSSPTYSLTSGGNQTRLYQSMPVVMGKHILLPDNAARYFSEYKGNDQYLYQTFHLGVSDLTVSDWKIGTTPIKDFQDVKWHETDKATGKMLDFPGNVFQIQGATLTKKADWITRETNENAYKAALDIESQIYYANDRGGMDSRSVSFMIEYSPALGEEVWTKFPGSPFTITGSSANTIRTTYAANFPKMGKYKVRIKRTTDDSTNSREGLRTNYTVMRSYQPDNATYIGQNRIGLEIKATEQLQGSVQQLSAMVSAKANYFDQKTQRWIYGETSNPAHWYADFAIGRFNAEGKLMYGVGMPKEGVDTAQLSAWAVFCDEEELTFNAVIDGSQTAADVLQTIARCGFGSPTWSSGKLGVVWDARNQAPVMAFGMSNIVKGSFTVRYLSQTDLAEEIIVRYKNPGNSWNQDEVRKKVPGVTAPRRTSSMDLVGCTNQKMAGKYVNYLAAQQYYRKRTVSWKSDIEAFVCQRGDVVVMSHDLTQWGYSGRFVGVGDDGLTVTLDRKVPLSETACYLMIKSPDGTLTTYKATPNPTDTSAETDELILSEAFTPQKGTSLIDSIWFYSPEPTPGKRVKIVSVRPISEYQLEVTATDEDPEFYKAWGGEFDKPDDHSLLPDPVTPKIQNLRVSERLVYSAGTQIVSRITISWDQLSSQVDSVAVRWRLDRGEWSSGTAFNANSFECDVDGNGVLEVTAVPTNAYRAGPSIATQQVIYGITMPPADVTGFTSNIDPNLGLSLSWDKAPTINIDGYEIRRGSTWDIATVIARVKSTDYTLPTLPSGTNTWWIKAVTTYGKYSNNAAFTTRSITPANAVKITGDFVGDSLVLNWTPTSGTFAVDTYQVKTGTDFSTAELVGTIKGTTYSYKASWGGSKRFWVTPYDISGQAGAEAAYDAVVTLPSAVDITAQVIDNNVLMRWSDATRTLALDCYQVRKGNTFASAEVVGTVKARFTNLFEMFAGTYTYWIAGVDVAGNIGTPTSEVVKVNRPPDFVLMYEFYSKFTGKSVNAANVNKMLFLPVDTTSTFEQHFESNKWASPDDQVKAGYPIYAQPTLREGSYEEELDYGSVIESTKITVTPTIRQIGDGPCEVTPTISVKLKAEDAWTDYVGLYEIFASNFQFVKVRLDVTAKDATEMVEVSKLFIGFSVKQLVDSGTNDVSASDAGGTPVLFRERFVNVQSIALSPVGSQPLTAVFDMNARTVVYPVGKPEPGIGPAYPTKFNVYLFDKNGNRASGVVSWTARGV